MENLAQEFSNRLEQLISDGKGEVQAFEITAQEFANQILAVTLNPLQYYFIDCSDITFKEGNIYFNLINPKQMEKESLIHEMITGIAKAHADSYTHLFPCASIFVAEHKRTYKPGDQVLVINDKLINSQGKTPTHEIVSLSGTLQDTKHQFTVKDLSTNEVKTIDL